MITYACKYRQNNHETEEKTYKKGYIPTLPATHQQKPHDTTHKQSIRSLQSSDQQAERADALRVSTSCRGVCKDVLQKRSTHTTAHAKDIPAIYKHIHCRQKTKKRNLEIFR